MKTANATAHSNIALVKYWGKRTGTEPSLNLPAVGSLSMTLDGLWTQTEVAAGPRDVLRLDGVAREDRPAARVWAHLDRLWADRKPGPRPPCAVTSTNHFPTAAGLASSASGFAALTVAAAAAFELDLSPEQISVHARMGSGSAARSVFGGFVRLDRGHLPDGSDCVARPIAGPEHWPLRLIVVQTTRGAKPTGSTEGMVRSRETSPYYAAWVQTSEADLDDAERALRSRDLARLGEIVEHSCMKMHACMMATRPPLLYWNGTTVSVMHAVWQARAEGLPGFVTVDAGPHVKVLCEPGAAEPLADRLRSIAGVEAVTVCAPGPAAQVQAGSPEGPR
jgi:diphosphomevalonate decarboxylase